MTDGQWAVIEPLLPRTAPQLGGRPHVYPRRLIIDTISYVLVSGCAWRLVPHDLAPWSIAYQWFRAWTADGTWDRVHEVLRDQVRIADGRDPQPSAAVLDSQSAKSSEGGEAIGYDAGKRVRGRKRHLLVDTLGLLLRVVVHSASVQDRAGAKLVLAGARARFPQLGLVWVDGGYVNIVDVNIVDAGLVGWAARHEGVEVVAVPRNADVKGFQVLPRRWVVERTFGWLTRCRRLARDYERKTAHAEAMIKFAMIRLMAARLAGEELPEPRSDVEKEAARRLAEDLEN
jgi:transposase